MCPRKDLGKTWISMPSFPIAFPCTSRPPSTSPPSKNHAVVADLIKIALSESGCSGTRQGGIDASDDPPAAGNHGRDFVVAAMSATSLVFSCSLGTPTIEPRK